ncbi:MAG: hypothetical protein AABW84_00610, partial [Nanoarchaeota archaeon]
INKEMRLKTFVCDADWKCEVERFIENIQNCQVGANMDPRPALQRGGRLFCKINLANTTIVNSSTSYAPVKDAGVWIKENSPENLIIYTMSVPQIQYYAERATLSYAGGAGEFDKIIASGEPAYFIMSIFEGHPDWVVQYLNENSNLEIVRVYNDQVGNPVLVIYGLKS